MVTNIITETSIYWVFSLYEALTQYTLEQCVFICQIHHWITSTTLHGIIITVNLYIWTLKTVRNLLEAIPFSSDTVSYLNKGSPSLLSEKIFKCTNNMKWTHICLLFQFKVASILSNFLNLHSHFNFSWNHMKAIYRCNNFILKN